MIVGADRVQLSHYQTAVGRACGDLPEPRDVVETGVVAPKAEWSLPMAVGLCESPVAVDTAPRLDRLETLQFLASRHVSIAADPTLANSEMTFDTAEHLAGQGLQPAIFAVLELDENHMSGYIGQFLSKTISPSVFGVRPVQWNGHTVAVADGKAYDPLVGSPVPQADYTRRAYGREMAFSQVYDAREVQAILERRRAL